MARRRTVCIEQKHSPLTEGGSIDDDDGVLDEGLGPDQLIVASVVDNVDDPGLAGSGLGGPGEVASVEPDILLLRSRHQEVVQLIIFPVICSAIVERMIVVFRKLKSTGKII